MIGHRKCCSDVAHSRHIAPLVCYCVCVCACLCATVHVRLLELSADIASMYVCNYVEADGRCRPGRSNFIIISRSRHVDMPPDVLALYAYQASSLCLDQFDAEFYNVTPSSGKLRAYPTRGNSASYSDDDCRLVADARERRVRSTESWTCVVTDP